MGGRKKNKGNGVPDFGDADACERGYHDRCIHSAVCFTPEAIAGDPTDTPSFVWTCGCRNNDCQAHQDETERAWKLSEEARRGRIPR